MTNIEFKLGTFSINGKSPYVGLVLDEEIYNLPFLAKAYGKDILSTTASIQGMLNNWETNFDGLRYITEFVRDEGRDAADWGGIKKLSDLKVLPPILKPGKMIYAAANYGGHIREMLNAGTAQNNDERDNMLDRDKTRVRPYSFLKSPSALVGAFDNIILPPESKKVDWEVELALAIGQIAKRVPAEKALEYVAG